VACLIDASWLAVAKQRRIRAIAQRGLVGDAEVAEVKGDMTAIHPGRYQHYKGKEYTVIGVALHSETQEELVVYRQEYCDHGLWMRPKQMFQETVTVDGQAVPRSWFLGDSR